MERRISLERFWMRNAHIAMKFAIKWAILEHFAGAPIAPSTSRAYIIVIECTI